MSEQSNRRRLIFAATAIAATVALLLAYQKLNLTSSPPASSLQRSNAVRRSRRRWRRGFTPRELGYNTVERALEHLATRITERRPYGRYDNRLLQFTPNPEDVEPGWSDLLPNRLDSIHALLSEGQPMTSEDKERLKYHLQVMFVQNFILEEFPTGWIIGGDAETLLHELDNWDIQRNYVRNLFHRFDHGQPFFPMSWDVRSWEFYPTSTDAADTHASDTHATEHDGPVDRSSTQQAIESLAGPHSVESDSSDDDDDDDDESDPGGSQNMLDLLYHIASDQAKREGFIHRDVGCNSCGQKPIQGIRYHCANCFDYDLCEDCEAQQIHIKTHVFYKVRIPAPPRGRIKQITPVWYPGQPNAFPVSMPRDLQRYLIEKVGMDKTEMEAAYEQFKCLAGQRIPPDDDPSRLGIAISRSNFDMFFTTSSADRPPIPNLIHDRIFAFYDIHNDGVITLDEYIIGIFTLTDKSRGARLDRMFKGYDLDADGYVDRKDFLRMFRAYYALSKEHSQEMASLQDELDDEIRDVVQGSQPISAAFNGHGFIGHQSRGGQDKEAGPNGDLTITSGPDGVLQNDTDMRGDRVRAIGNAAIRDLRRTHPFRSFRRPPETDEMLLYPPIVSTNRDGASIPLAADMDDDVSVGPDPGLHVYGWPPQQTPEPEDIVTALGVDIPLEDITDPIDRSRIIYAQVQRLDDESDQILQARRDDAVRDLWRRRQFYLDEEEGLTRPPGYTEPDSSDDEAASIDTPPEVAPQTSASSRRQSMRSRSSSKVRFEDSTIDTDHETRSNTSSRSIPVNERWGGFELSAPERDIGREILYQAVQRGFNELLDPLFKRKEDEALTAIATKGHRIKWAKEIKEREAVVAKRHADRAEALRQEDLLRAQALSSNGVDAAASDGGASAPHARPSTPATLHDDTDHVQLMFGNSPSTSPAKPGASELGADPSTPSTSEVSVDPTLPQNMPNEPGIGVGSGVSVTSAEPAPSTPTDVMLETWIKHQRVEEEAIERGGYGKLSFREFCRLMIREANRDRYQEFKTDSTGRPRTGEDDDDSNEADDSDEQMWAPNGDLGRVSFCGAWLEMSQF